LEAEKYITKTLQIQNDYLERTSDGIAFKGKFIKKSTQKN